ncbi:HAD family hydrolase [Ancylothrix sp. C2]|uniref:HAD family hydrolase n=1 Tax=Ancylothrix sp. D3o TaxID=2953691 RepID=UPI0021BB0196|nr:HAD family hydrolase [Ancylothrix sp. D3o]MCT7951783.1 HAD family hydrolase [Ancylothrix sp. D3o]
MLLAPNILALDFDGVLCDGLLEYYQAAWRTYTLIWQPPNPTPPADLAPKFYRLRPVIETGWEMPLLIHALIQGIDEPQILKNWPSIAQTLLLQENLKAVELGAKLDNLRDQWIATNLNDWLSYHRFYPGTLEKIKQLLETSHKTVIITTKEGRFVRQLLEQQNLNFPEQLIFGKEQKRPKQTILKELIDHSPPNTLIWFVEDRLKTLQLVQQQPDLAGVGLFLADWGYNTADERNQAQLNPQIHLLSLPQFAGDFSGWV